MEKKTIKRLIKNGDIILDGTLTRYEKDLWKQQGVYRNRERKTL